MLIAIDKIEKILYFVGFFFSSSFSHKNFPMISWFSYGRTVHLHI